MVGLQIRVGGVEVLEGVGVAVVAEVVHHVRLELLLGLQREHRLAHRAQLRLLRHARRDAHQHAVLLITRTRAAKYGYFLH